MKLESLRAWIITSATVTGVPKSYFNHPFDVLPLADHRVAALLSKASEAGNPEKTLCALAVPPLHWSAPPGVARISTSAAEKVDPPLFERAIWMRQ